MQWVFHSLEFPKTAVNKGLRYVVLSVALAINLVSEVLGYAWSGDASPRLRMCFFLTGLLARGQVSPGKHRFKTLSSYHGNLAKLIISNLFVEGELRITCSRRY